MSRVDEYGNIACRRPKISIYFSRSRAVPTNSRYVASW